MPNFDHTGPMGQGPMTGRRMGRCTNFGNSLKKKIQQFDENQIEPQSDTFFGGRFCRGRFGRGRGFGRQNRFRNGF